MKDVADRAGVHPSTVSRVLSNSSRVTPATREKVLAAVDVLAYRPNRYISALMRNRRQRQTPAPFLAGDWGREPFLEWIDSERPDAILCYTRHGLPFEWLESAGIRVPEEIGVASLACSQGGSVSGVLERWELQAIRGVNLVIDLLADNTLGTHECPNVSIVDAGWNPGNTLRRVNGQRPNL